MHQIPVSKAPAQSGDRLGDGISNTKQAAVLATIGLPFREYGISVVYDEDHPKSSGGQAKFYFEKECSSEVRRLIEIYEDEKADVRFDELCENLKEDLKNGGNGTAAVIILQRAYTNALAVWGRHFIENYIRLVQFIRDGANQFVMTGGEPAYDQSTGEVVGKQHFQVRYVPRKR